MRRKLIVDIICLIFVIVFTYAAVTKLIDHNKFSVQIGQSPMLTRWAFFIAWFIPLSELMISLMLIHPRLQKPGLYAALNLMIMFTAYIIIVMRYSPFVPCSCGGVLEKLGWSEHLVFNCFFVALATAAIILADGSRSPWHLRWSAGNKTSK